MISRVSEGIHAAIELFEKKRSKLSFEESRSDPSCLKKFI